METPVKVGGALLHAGGTVITTLLLLAGVGLSFAVSQCVCVTGATGAMLTCTLPTWLAQGQCPVKPGTQGCRSPALLGLLGNP